MGWDSIELSDQPKWQYGVQTTWRPIDRFSLSLEYLYGSFQNDFAFDNKDNELNKRYLQPFNYRLNFDGV